MIGVDGGLPWRLPDDLAHFKEPHDGPRAVMGRRTYDSIGRPLPGRTTVVVTRQPDWRSARTEAYARRVQRRSSRLRQSTTRCSSSAAPVYAEALPLADRLELTHVDAAPEGDTFFPQVDWSEWREVRREARGRLVAT